MSDALGYVIVYWASGLGPDPWADLGNDPDRGHDPMTWGICRPDVRQYVRPDQDLFFVARIPKAINGEKYFYTARLQVEDKISHLEARRQLGIATNVILDELPPGPNPRQRLAMYAGMHRAELQWTSTDLGSLDSPDGGLAALTIGDADGLLVHSFWDSHEDWRRRAEAPYVLGSPLSTRLDSPLAWSDLVRELPELPAELSNASHKHSVRRVWSAQTRSRLAALSL